LHPKSVASPPVCAPVHRPLCNHTDSSLCSILTIVPPGMRAPPVGTTCCARKTKPQFDAPPRGPLLYCAHQGYFCACAGAAWTDVAAAIAAAQSNGFVVAALIDVGLWCYTI
jgi:hypothetical protein